MRLLRRMLNMALYACLTAVVSFLLLLGADRMLPLACRIPPYVPALSAMKMPNPSQRWVSCDFDCVSHANSLGLRGPEVSIPKKGGFRIAVIGSSCTFGWGVNDDACFVRLLERGLRDRGIDVEVLNLGKNGASPPQYALLAEETLPLFRPDLVIVAVDQGIDLEWANPAPMRERMSHEAWMRWPNLSSLINAQGTPQETLSPMPDPTADEVASAKKWAIQLAQKTYDEFTPVERARFDALDAEVKTVFFAGNLNLGILQLSTGNPDLYTLTLDMNSEHTRERLVRFGKYLRRVARAAEKVSASTLIVSVPLGVYVNEDSLKNFQRLGFQAVDGMLTVTTPDDAIKEAAGKLPFLTVTDAFRRQSSNPRLFFKSDLHMTADGHALFAEQILPWVEKHVRETMSKPAGRES